jgi:hypothetical protein
LQVMCNVSKETGTPVVKRRGSSMSRLHHGVSCRVSTGWCLPATVRTRPGEASRRPERAAALNGASTVEWVEGGGIRLEQLLHFRGALLGHTDGAPVASLRLLLRDDLPQYHPVAETIHLHTPLTSVDSTSFAEYMSPKGENLQQFTHAGLRIQLCMPRKLGKDA